MPVSLHLFTRQYVWLVIGRAAMIGRNPEEYDTHSLRRTKATPWLAVGRRTCERSSYFSVIPNWRVRSGAWASRSMMPWRSQSRLNRRGAAASAFGDFQVKAVAHPRVSAANDLNALYVRQSCHFIATSNAPAEIKHMPSQLPSDNFSLKNANPKIATKTTLNLSMGATCEAFPILRARR